MQSLAPGVYYQPSYRGVNLGLIETQEGVVLVDTPMLPSVAMDWAEQARKVGPIRYVVNTDHLQEHVMGNPYIPGDVIAHEDTRTRMRMTDKAKEQYRKYVLDHDDDDRAADLVADYDLRFPNITIFDRLTIHLGERLFELIHLPGHTSNSIGLYLPQARVLFAGDVVVNKYRAYLGLSTIPDWQMTLKAIEVMRIDWIVPGHGKPLSPRSLGPLAEYLERMRGRVEELIEEGRTRDEVVSRMMPFFEEWPIDNQRRDEERNLYRQGVRQIYDQLTGRR